MDDDKLNISDDGTLPIDGGAALPVDEDLDGEDETLADKVEAEDEEADPIEDSF